MNVSFFFPSFSCKLKHQLRLATLSWLFSIYFPSPRHLKFLQNRLLLLGAAAAAVAFSAPGHVAIMSEVEQQKKGDAMRLHPLLQQLQQQRHLPQQDDSPKRKKYIHYIIAASRGGLDQHYPRLSKHFSLFK